MLLKINSYDLQCSILTNSDINNDIFCILPTVRLKKLLGRKIAAEDVDGSDVTLEILQSGSCGTIN